jgi:NAD(P)H dehydrogenase (quinone)
MKTIAIVYHSGFGHTEFVANKVKSGITKSNVLMYKVSDFFENESKLAELEKADMIVFGSPTYMGSVSADFKKFMDMSSKVWYSQKWKDKFAAGFTCSASLNGDKANTMSTLFTFAAQNSMVWVSQGIFSDGVLNPLGSWIGLYTKAENAAPETSFDEQNIKTSIAFGKRLDDYLSSK